jgi:hypothetical protein
VPHGQFRYVHYARNEKKARQVLWYPTQAKVRLEWGTQPSLPVKKPVTGPDGTFIFAGFDR